MTQETGFLTKFHFGFQKCPFGILKFRFGFCLFVIFTVFHDVPKVILCLIWMCTTVDMS